MSSLETATFSNWETAAGASAYPPRIQLADVERGTTYTGWLADTVAPRGVEADPNATSTSRINTAAETSETLTQEGMKEKVKEIKDGNLGAAPPLGKTHYFFLGDLLAVVFDNITGADAFKSQFITNLDILLNPRSTGEGVANALLGAAAAIGSIPAKVALAKRLEDDTVGQPIGVPSTVKDVLKNFRIILGNIDMRFKNDPSVVHSINLAHVPITVSSFNQFMIDIVFSADVDNYPFFQFVNDLISNVVTSTLGTKCFGGLIDNSTRAQTLVINSTKDLSDEIVVGPTTAAASSTLLVPPQASAGAGPTDPRPYYRSLSLSDIGPSNPLINNCGDASSRSNVFEYFIIATANVDDSMLNGDVSEDFKQGIYHLGYGLDRGLVKNMKFEKTNQEFLPEAQFASEGGLLLNQLANAFDVSIEMVGNNLFKIGQLVYIDAEAFNAGPSWADIGEAPNRQRSWSNIMGLGGYHLITEIAHSITPEGGFVTTIKARWQSGGTREDWRI